MAEILKIADKDSRNNLAKNLGNLHNRQGVLLEKFMDLKLSQSNYTNIKWSVLSNLEESLSIFENNFNASNSRVLWARNEEDVRDALDEIYEVNEVSQTYVAGESETFEVNVRAHLFSKNIDFKEINLGHQILDLVEEDGAHPSLPTLAKSESEIRTIIESKTESKIATFLNKHFESCKETKNKLSIIVPDHLIAEEGLLSYSDDEGLKTKLIHQSDTIVFIAGLNRIVPSLKAYSQMLRLETTMQQGSDLKANHGLFKPQTHQQVYVLLLDNDRVKLLKNRSFKSLLYDPDGTALISQDNIYRKAMKPDGSTAYYDQGHEMKGYAISPTKVNAEIAYASTLSFDKFRSVTTVDYDRLNTALRKRFIVANKSGFVNKLKRQVWTKILLDRKLMNSEGFGIKKRMLNWIFDSEWRRYRDVPQPNKQTFNQLWSTRRKSL